MPPFLDFLGLKHGF